MADEAQTPEVKLLTEIVKWTREAALPMVRSRVQRLLDSEPKKRVYEAIATGSLSVTDLEKATGVNHNDVRSWVNQWRAEGIVDADANPPKALFTLHELGIEPAPLLVRKARKPKLQ